MASDSPLDRLDRVLADPPRVVRINSPRPPPPHRRRVAAVPEMRVIIPLEGVKEEIFGDGHAVQHWAMVPGDALVLRPDTWLCPIFSTRHRHLGIIVDADFVRLGWTRCDGDDELPQPLVREAWGEVAMPDGTALRRAADTLVALDGRETIAAAGPPLLAGLLHLLREALARPAPPAGRRDRTWRAVVTHVHDHCHLAIGRDDVAGALGLSPNYLSRLCRQRSGRPFIEWLNGIRLERAARMLRHVELPVNEVARACGFNDPGYFIRRFRRSYGATPAAWRRAPG